MIRFVDMLGMTVGSYRITNQIGEGGMAMVYLAQHTTLDIKAVVKVLRPRFHTSKEMQKRFLNEANAIAGLRHPCIVNVLDVGRLEQGSLYILMEYLEGQTLRERLERDTRVPIPSAVLFARQSADALGAAHERGIIHRDVKPANIFLIRDPLLPGGERIKLLDFGLAKLTHDISSSLVTNVGALMGTPTYMSPEQCQDAGVVDARTDIYALGCILFEMVCGRPPFVSTGIGEMITFHIAEPPPRMREFNKDVPRELDDVVACMLAKRPDERYPSARALMDALDDLSVEQRGGEVESQRGGSSARRAVAPTTHAAADSSTKSTSNDKREVNRTGSGKHEIVAGAGQRTATRAPESVRQSPRASEPGGRQSPRASEPGNKGAARRAEQARAETLPPLLETAEELSMADQLETLEDGDPFLSGHVPGELFTGDTRPTDVNTRLPEFLRQDGAPGALDDSYADVTVPSRAPEFTPGYGAQGNTNRAAQASPSSQTRVTPQGLAAYKTPHAPQPTSKLAKLSALSPERRMQLIYGAVILLAALVLIYALVLVAGKLGSSTDSKDSNERPVSTTKAVEPVVSTVSFEVAAPQSRFRPALIKLGGGTFTMGAPGDQKSWTDERPSHQVEVEPFYICQSEVTQSHWTAIMKTNPSDCDHGCGRTLPVQNVSWLDAVEYFNRLSDGEGLTRCYEGKDSEIRWIRDCDGYRFPTEAEWEFAARAGSATLYSFGSDLKAVDEYAWYKDNAGGKVHPVGEKRPNAWGLVDMSGNVQEWVWDRYSSYTEVSQHDPSGPDKDAQEDSTGPQKGTWRVKRGGSFENDADYMRSSIRMYSFPESRKPDIGLRCARSVTEGK